MSRVSLADRAWLPAALFCLAAALSVAFSMGGETHAQRGATPKQSDRFSNVSLYTQQGETVRFYDDLVKNKTVVINFMYSGCGEICPANTAELAKINRLLGPRMGRDVIMLSLSIDPLHDTPQRLKQYWELVWKQARLAVPDGSIRGYRPLAPRTRGL